MEASISPAIEALPPSARLGIGVKNGIVKLVSEDVAVLSVPVIAVLMVVPFNKVVNVGVGNTVVLVLVQVSVLILSVRVSAARVNGPPPVEGPLDVPLDSVEVDFAAVLVLVLMSTVLVTVPVLPPLLVIEASKQAQALWILEGAY